MATPNLERINPSSLKRVTDPSGIDVYHVSNQHVLVQAAGYLKFAHDAANSGSVVFRGQSKLYSTLVPSLYRTIRTQSGKDKRDQALAAYLQQIDRETAVLNPVPKYAREPLLQHYGIRTKWIDAVDNLWVALWFAAFEAHTTGKFGQYLHFERRSTVTERYAYIILLRCEGQPEQNCPGLISGQTAQLIDLRVAAPSTFVRPHAQHGLLIKRTKDLKINNVDYSDMVAAILRVNLSDAFQWLGEGNLVTAHALFPPAKYDFGYFELLEYAPEGNERVAAIYQVAP